MKIIKSRTMVSRGVVIVVREDNPWLTAIDILQAAVGTMALMTASALVAVALVS